MSPWESMRMAFSALLANKGRSALTVLGVVIGITAVIALVGVGQGAQVEVTNSIESLGSNLLFVRQSARVPGADDISEGDLEAVRAMSGVADVAAEALVSGNVAYRGETSTPSVTGTSPAWTEVRNTRVVAGRFVSEEDVRRAARVAVVGSEVEEDLGAETLLGERITINGVPFTVVGVLETKGSLGVYSPDNVVVIPATTALSRLTGRGGYDALAIQVADSMQMERVQTEVEAVLRSRHRIAEGAEDDFTVTSQADILETVSDITGILTALLGSIAGISLLVGGIGIMNIMLVSVTERTRDIGIRKAIGARRRDIVSQFLIESLVLSIFGGLLGVLGGFLLSRVLGPVVGFGAVITPQSVGLAVGVSAAIGIFFGVYPAWKAGCQDPIEALRYE